MKRLFFLLLLILPTVRPSGRPAASLTIGRLHYDGGGDWYANPSSLPNLLAALRERTTLSVADRERVVTLTGPELGDGWEDSTVHHDPPERHEAALRMGVNLFMYAVSGTK